MTSDQTMLFKVDVLRNEENESGMLVAYEGEEIWLPKKVVRLIEEDSEVEVPLWLARAKGML